MTTWTPETIKQLRTRLGMTQAQFAAAIAAHPQTVAWWEQGKRTPTGLYAAALDRLTRDLPPRLSESLTATATAFEEEIAAAIADGDPETATTYQRIAGHLRRLAYTHRAAADYRDKPELDPRQTTTPAP